MPRISTDNYDTVASWNGTQDLFIVEQPDGTKVATPAMVKQFIEAGDFEATGEVKDGHGNILADMARADEVKGIAEAGDFVATGEVKDGNGNILADMVKASELEIALANLDNLRPTPVDIDGTPQNLFTLFKGLPKNRLHVKRINGTQSSASIFGGSSFTVIGVFTSNNYGWILCLSDNAVCGFKHLTVNDGTVAYLQRPTVTVTSYNVS